MVSPLCGGMGGGGEGERGEEVVQLRGKAGLQGNSCGNSQLLKVVCRAIVVVTHNYCRLDAREQ